MLEKAGRKAVETYAHTDTYTHTNTQQQQADYGKRKRLIDVRMQTITW